MVLRAVKWDRTYFRAVRVNLSFEVAQSSLHRGEIGCNPRPSSNMTRDSGVVGFEQLMRDVLHISRSSASVLTRCGPSLYWTS